jgi:dephospho-CoA kinase
VILKVGLTGGIASGKSTVARILQDAGCVVLDADALVHQMYEPGQPAYQAVVSQFGKTILNSDGTINRRRLAEIAFPSPEQTARLNALVHPLVLAREAELMAELERGGEDRIVVVEATLLLESGGRERHDRIVVVDAPPELQIERAVRRGMSRQDVEQRISRQMPAAERLRLADYVIRNEGTPPQLVEQTRPLHRKLIADLREKKRKAKRKTPREKRGAF